MLLKYKMIPVVMFVLLLMACSAVAELDEHVQIVKTGHPEAYPELEHGKVFGEFFGNPTWEYFKSDDDQDIVEFKGTCRVLDKEAKAKMQFILDTENNSFEVGALSFNDIPQIQLMTFCLISKAFETYADDHDIKLANRSDDILNFDNYVQFEETEETEETEEKSEEYQNNNAVPPATVIYETADDEEEYYNVKADGYYDIFPESNARYLDAIDVEDMDAYTVRLGLNEIYARHGRTFKDANLQNYFNSQPWYTPVYTPEEFNAIENSVFNAYEKANVKFLADLIR